MPATGPEGTSVRAGELKAAGDRIEALLEATAAAGPTSRSRAEELVASVSTLYGAGLERLLEIVDELGGLTDDVADAIADDELLTGLLLVHDLHPYDAPTRIRRALAAVRPYLGSHGGDVELLDIDADGVVRLRLLGSCDGCPSSSATLELAVESAIRAAAPEITGIEVDTTNPAPPPAGVIPLDALRTRLDRPTAPPAGWLAVPNPGAIPPAAAVAVELGGVPVCVCRIGNEFFCFRDRCAHCEQTLAGGAVERRLGDAAGNGVLRCPHCHAHFDVRRAGASIDGPDERLEPLPVLYRNGVASVAVPMAAT